MREIKISVDVNEKELQRVLNNDVEKMSRKDAERSMNLINNIFTVIEAEKNYTYQDVIRALEAVKRNYERNGKNLLNSVSIQEVAKFGGLLN